MSLFGDLTTKGTEEVTDSLGGVTRLDSDIYSGKIKVAYLGASESGAKNLTIVALLNGKEYTETVYFTNREGKNTYEKNGKHFQLPGFVVFNDLCEILLGKEVSDLVKEDTEEKVVNVWDSKERKEVPKSVMTLAGMTGADVELAIVKSLEDKTKLEGGEYISTGETIEKNNIDKVFHPELHITVVEAKAGKKEPEFRDKWLEKNKGVTRDKSSKGDKAKAGAPPKAGASSNKPKSSLFGG